MSDPAVPDSQSQLSPSPVANSAGDTFHPFPRLPFELRRSIWKLCRPNRVLDVDWVPHDFNLLTTCQGLGLTSVLNSKPPIITRICRESRAVAFERDVNHDEKCLSEDTAPESDLFSNFWERPPYWFNASADIIHLNWNPDLEYNAWDNDGNPILEFLRVASQGMGASITAELLYSSIISPIFRPYPYFNESRNGANLDMLESRKEYLVTLKMINLHLRVEDTLASGLFGRLGEERIVLVPTDDEDTLRKYQKLWFSRSSADLEPGIFFEELWDSATLVDKARKWKHESELYWMRFKCEQAIRKGTAAQGDLDAIWFETARPINTKPETFEDGPASDSTDLFNKSHPFAKKVLDEMPQFSPVFMFRLCEMDCPKINEQIPTT